MSAIGIALGTNGTSPGISVANLKDFRRNAAVAKNDGTRVGGGGSGVETGGSVGVGLPSTRNQDSAPMTMVIVKLFKVFPIDEAKT